MYGAGQAAVAARPAPQHERRSSLDHASRSVGSPSLAVDECSGHNRGNIVFYAPGSRG
jgi:hypothetical protein